MTQSIAVPANEFKVVRVFALSMSDADARALSTNASGGSGPSPLELALGSEALNDAHVEVLMLSDLGDMSFADYLIDGAGVPPSEIEPDRFRLAALEGWAMVVYSSAFQGTAQVLNPSAELTLIGSYRQDPEEWTPPVDLSTPSALPKETAPPARKAPSDAAMSGRIAMLALLVAFLVVGLMIWIAG